MDREDKPFEIRRHVCNVDYASPEVLAAYDAIDRTAALIGDIPFSALFRTPLAVLVPQLLPRLESIAKRGLLSDRKAAEASLEMFRRAASDWSVEQMFEHSWTSYPEGVVASLKTLHRLGFHWPIPAERHVPDQLRAIAGLCQDAGARTYIDQFSLTRAEFGLDACRALHHAVETGVLKKSKNDQCCFSHKSATGDTCSFYTDSGCTMASGGTYCAASADVCPGCPV